MKTFRMIEGFIEELHSKKKLIIYGAGWGGKSVHRFLKKRAITVTAFASTVQECVVIQDGIPVYCLDDILRNNHRKDLIIILAATKENRHTMKRELEIRGIDSYIELSDSMLYQTVIENRKNDARREEKNKGKYKDKEMVGYVAPGYMDTDYAEQRLIIEKIRDISYMFIPKETAENMIEESLYENNWEGYRQLTEACYCPREYMPEVKYIHTFNMVCQTEIFWWASFETIIPRVWPKTEKEKEYYLQLIKYLKLSNCKTLYALSRNAYEIQKHTLISELNSKDVDFLMEKTKVLHPPQEILITNDEFDKKHNSKQIQFIFIGRTFFIKGGREIVQALSEFEDKYNFRLTLISSLIYDDYFTKTSFEEMKMYKEVIQNKKWIDYYESLPNEKVLEKCKEATVGLLPSVAETYGYAVLEMQASGCPVVTTNIRAFPEINNDECGWVCQLPVDSLGCCAEQSDKVWSNILREELKRCFRDIFTHPELIRQKGIKALERIQRMHDKYQEELRKNLEN